MTITLRQESDSRATTKGSALTFTELDNNFKDILDRATLIVEDSSNTQKSIGTTSPELKITGTGSISTTIEQDSTGGGVLTIASTAITDIQNDSSPQLGGNLDVNRQQIVTTSNGNIVLAPNGTGQTLGSRPGSTMKAGQCCTLPKGAQKSSRSQTTHADRGGRSRPVL